jgi:hypothetical protein
MSRPCSDTSQITAKQSTSYFSNFRAAEHKKGLKLMKKTQRTFEAFVEHVPAGLLANEGLKRHYKIFGIITAVDGDLSKTPDAKAA